MSLQDVLAGLQKNYLAALPEKLSLIESLWTKQDYTLLKTEYHKLKGTGRTYGIPEISQLGAAVERLCERRDAQLGKAIDLSVEILKRIRNARISGAPYPLDDDTDFKSIEALVGN